jgi:DNA primase
MSLPDGFVDDLRGRVSLAQLVGRKVAWDSRKSNPARGDFWAPCPFHQEKTASFHVDDAKGYYYCFGCHAKGDAVTFLRQTESLGFMEAVERLAREAGVEMPDRDPAAAARAAARDGLAEAMEAAVQFYRLHLNAARAAEARAYLDRRGVTSATRDRFELGFAPEARTALLDHLTGKGFSRDRLAEAGLIGLPDSGSPYDRFRNRIMFPIRDARGRAIAFGARAIASGQEPKYLNSPDTPLFDKGRTLYNVGPARAAAARAGTVVVAEGYMDVIALAQAGIDHAVAPLGTAVTERQLEALWKLAPEPVVALDGDPAGLAAAQRLIDLALPLLGPGRSLRFALMPPGQDPDDVVRAGGARAMQALIDASQPVVELLWRRETEGRPLDSPERRAALDARLRAHLARIADPSLRNHWQAELRARRAALFAPPPRPGRGPAPRRARASSPATHSLLARQPDADAAAARGREGVILYGCLSHPELALAREHLIERLEFRCPDLGKIRDALLSALAESPHTPQAGDSLAGAIRARIGFDPLAALAAIGHVRMSRHFGPEASPDVAGRALDEELTRHVALAGLRAETREAEAELGAATADEGLTWRLRAAAEASERAAAEALAGVEADAEAEAALSATLHTLTDPQFWRKPRRR